MDNFKQLIKEALTPKFLKEEIDAEYILNNLDKWLPNLSPGPFHFYDIIDDGDVDEMVDLIHTYGDEEVLKDYGLDPWDRGDVTQLADYIISRGNKETDLAPQGKRTIGLKNEVVGLGDSQPKDDDEDPDDRPAHEAGSFATNEEVDRHLGYLIGEVDDIEVDAMMEDPQIQEYVDTERLAFVRLDTSYRDAYEMFVNRSDIEVKKYIMNNYSANYNPI